MSQLLLNSVHSSMKGISSLIIMHIMYLNAALNKPVDVEGLLQWTKNQLQPLHLWEMPVLVERVSTPTHNPVKKDNSKLTITLVKASMQCSC